MPRVSLPDLSSWLASRRWFSAKDDRIQACEVTQVVPVTTDGPWLVVVTAQVGASPSRARRSRWLLALASVADGDPAAVGTIDGTRVADIADAPDAARALADAVLAGRGLSTRDGWTVEVEPGATPDADPAELPARAARVEQSNTSVFLGDALMVKVLRHLEPGPNPEIELTAALTEGQVAGIPPFHGALVGPDEEALVILSTFIAGARGGWELAVEEARGAADHGVGTGMRNLGAMTAAVHHELATLGTSALDRRGLRSFANRLRTDVATTRHVADAAGAELPTRLADTIEDALGEVARTLRSGVSLQRIHGDLHLGQVLLDRDRRWWMLDFEGEPGRAIAHRRERWHPLYDVAGMTRSLRYARAAAIRAGADPDHADRWASSARRDYLDGYGETGPWLRLFELDKLLYEVRYEAANRPDWLSIPLQDLTGLATPQPSATTEVPMSVDQSEPESTKPDTAQPAAPQAESPQPAQPQPAASRASSAPTGPSDIELLSEGRLHEPHGLLGKHPHDGGWIVRAWRPGATGAVLEHDGQAITAEEVSPGLFAATCDTEPDVGSYRWRIAYPDGQQFTIVDPYAFLPTLGEMDMHLLAEGRHEEAWSVMGANRRTMNGIDGVAFSVWAPNAQAVRVVGSFNSWDGRLHPMRSLGSSGIWELFVPDVEDGAHYKYELVAADGHLQLRADPWAKWSDVPPGTASRVHTSTYQAAHDRPDGEPLAKPMTIYEVHLGSWRHADGQPLTYRQLAAELVPYVQDMGFTHVEFLPPAEHPFGGSWGYQVTGHFAPTARFGNPDDFRHLVDTLHGAGIGVIIDWVPAHFPRDTWALARFDGTALYEHDDPRQGEHPDWGTLVFNYGRTEVRNFLLASGLFWLEAIGVDALRVDAVASMLYLDYSRNEGEWVPNEFGGRENLEAVSLLQEVNATAYKRNPRTFTVAEESTAWPGVSRPTHLGGLGFGFKWNMGWMHDTLSYFAKDPVHRRWHHNQLTFGMMYAWSEHFILPLSHDEVVHGKGSLLGKMPGDRWQQFANLRSLYGWMWGHPGKKLLFMGGEFGQPSEWSEERQLDWGLLDDSMHAGVRGLVRDANRVYTEQPALWRRDHEPEGFGWIDANNADDNLLSFVRYGDDDDPPVAVIANLSPVPRHGIRFGLPRAGHWAEALNTDAEIYGGGNVGNLGGVHAVEQPYHGLPCSAEVTVPPLGVVWLLWQG